MTNKTIKNKYQLSPLNKEYNEHDYIEPFNINYLLFKNDIYRLIKFNDIRFILKNMTTKEQVYIKYTLFNALEKIHNIKEVIEERDIKGHPNKFLKTFTDDIYFYNHKETVKPNTRKRKPKQTTIF
jgi:hypothetical protein